MSSRLRFKSDPVWAILQPDEAQPMFFYMRRSEIPDVTDLKEFLWQQALLMANARPVAHEMDL